MVRPSIKDVYFRSNATRKKSKRHSRNRRKEETNQLLFKSRIVQRLPPEIVRQIFDRLFTDETDIAIFDDSQVSARESLKRMLLIAFLSRGLMAHVLGALSGCLSGLTRELEEMQQRSRQRHQVIRPYMIRDTLTLWMKITLYERRIKGVTRLVEHFRRILGLEET